MFNICFIFKGSKTKLLLTCICLTFLVTFVFISDTILFMKAQTVMGQVNEVVGFKKTTQNVYVPPCSALVPQGW